LTAFTLLFAYAGHSQGSGTALTFNGTNQKVNVPSTLSSVTNNFTMEFWANPTNTLTIRTQSNTIGNITGTSAQRYAIFPTHGGNPCASAAASAGLGVSVGTNGIQVFEHNCSHMPAILVYNATLPSGWNHIAVVVTSKQPQLYLNGNLVATGLTSNLTNIYPGGNIGGDNYGWYQGDLDEVRIWSTSRTQAQIRDKMCTRLNGNETGLVRYYRFDDGSGTQLTESTSNAQHGTLSNTPTWATSGAPIGNTSTYTYTTSWSGVSLYHVSPEGDSLQVSAVSSATVNAIHIYHVTSVPNTTSGITGYGGNDHYFGVFKSINSGGSGTYTATYYYRQNDAYQASSTVDPDYDENNLRVFTRSDNAATPWTMNAAVPTTSSKTIALTAMSTEFMLGYLNSTAALPIELLFFEALAHNNSTLLDWCTASEINNHYFTVERSQNGSHFESIVQIPGAGNSNQNLCYSANDLHPYQGINYYRLKQTDYNGASTYSQVVTVFFSEKNTVLLYPNPANELIYIHSSGSNPLQVEICDAQGKLLVQTSLQQNQAEINVSGLTPGIYFCAFSMETNGPIYLSSENNRKD
jgi:hypothetical protein